MRKKIRNLEKYFKAKERRKMESGKRFQESAKIFQNREKYCIIKRKKEKFQIEKNVSESRNILLQEKSFEFNDFEFNKRLS